MSFFFFFFFSSRRRHTRCSRDWSSDVCSSDLREHRIISGGYPYIHSIEVSNNCNLDCVMCNRDEHKTRGMGFMGLSRFKDLMDGYGRCFKALALFFHGEPLLHKNIVEMVEYARPRASTVNLTTNGTLLTPELADGLMKAGLYSLCISYEGADKETYEGI